MESTRILTALRTLASQADNSRLASILREVATEYEAGDLRPLEAACVHIGFKRLALADLHGWKGPAVNSARLPFWTEPGVPIAPGNVYIIGPVEGAYKIGRAHNLRHRLRQYSHPKRLEVRLEVPTHDRIGLEAAFHAHYADKQRYGEWFDLLPADLDMLREAVGSAKVKAA